jgi:hypothetical protein
VPRHTTHVIHVRMGEQDRVARHDRVRHATDVESDLELRQVNARLQASNGDALDTDAVGKNHAVSILAAR